MSQFCVLFVLLLFYNLVSAILRYFMGKVLKSLETDARVTHIMLYFQRFINQIPEWLFRSTEKKCKE